MLTNREKYMFLILAFVVAVLIGAFFLLKEEVIVVTPPSEEIENIAPQVEQERTITGVVIPSEVYTYVGKVNDIQADYILVSAESHNNYLEEDTVFEVHFDESTVFELYSFPRVLRSDVTAVERTVGTIKFSEINVGDIVTVSAPENTRGKKQFFANKIIVSRPL